MPTHVMIDLETLGTSSDAALISIGAVKFDPLDESQELDRFYVAIEPQSCLTHGLKVSGATLMWWLDEKRASARADFLNSERTDLASALDGFAMWFGTESVPVWGNGASFDNVILRTAFDKLFMPCPWEFWHDRCYRTVKSIAGSPEIERSGVYHNALDDAVSQARHLQKILAQHEILV